MSNEFQFSSASKAYVENLAVVHEAQESSETELRELVANNRDLIAAMRAETYTNVAAFGEQLLARLALTEPLKNAQVQSMKTTPQGKYAGGRIHYLWIDSASGTGTSRRPCEVGMVYFALPLPVKVPISNDEAWENYWSVFDPVKNNRMKIWLGYEGSDTNARNRIIGLARTENLGSFIQQDSPNRCCMWLPLDKQRPVDSAVDGLSAIVRAIYEAEKSG